MSSGQAPKRRSPIERSQYAPAPPPADQRRRQLDALGQDRAAIERAKQDIAEMSRQQGGRARAPIQFDDIEVQERKPRQMIVAPAPQVAPAPAPGAEVSAQPADSDRPSVAPGIPAQPGSAAAASKQVHISTTTSSSRTKFEHVEHRPVLASAPARSIPAAQPTPYSRGEQYRPAVAHVPVYDTQPYWEAPVSLARSQPLVLMFLIALVCGGVIWMFRQSSQTFISSYGGSGWSEVAGAAANQALGQALGAVNVASGEHSVVGAPSISAAAIDTILANYGSPAAGTGQAWVKLGQQYGIDPAYAVAFFIHESSAGTNPGWAGMKPDGSTTHNVGNIICAGYATCYGRFRDYASWDEGIGDWYKLISNEYVTGRGAASVEQIIPIYAPSSDNNDVPGYINVVVSMVDSWRAGVLR
jgi:hypothetical protein